MSLRESVLPERIGEMDLISKASTVHKLLSLLAGNHELWATIRATNGFLQQIIVASGFWLVIVIA